MEEQMFITEIADNVAFITMQAPQNNLMTAEFFVEYEKTMQEIEELAEKGEISGIIISGKSRHFSVGADVPSLAERSMNDLQNMKSDTDFSDGHIKQKHLVTFLHDLKIPVISAVSGFCIGSGSEIAINSHIRVCDKSARIGQPESTFGILPGLGGVARTAEYLGLTTAFEMVMSGELMSAQQAYEIGWADILTEKKQALPTAKKLMNYILLQSEKYDPLSTARYISGFLKETANE